MLRFAKYFRLALVYARDNTGARGCRSNYLLTRHRGFARFLSAKCAAECATSYCEMRNFALPVVSPRYTFIAPKNMGTIALFNLCKQVFKRIRNSAKCPYFQLIV